MSVASVTELSRSFRERGFHLLPSVYTPAECDRMAELLDAYWETHGRLAFSGFGLAVHPLLQKIPGFADFLIRQVVYDALEEILGDQPHLVHSGARVSNESSVPRLDWHDHYQWNAAGLLTRDRIERVLFGCYIRGLSDETGPLVVMPRKMNDPLGKIAVPPGEYWPGEVAVMAPPGSVVIFDTALYHAARRGTKPGRRYLWGTHVQGLHDTRPHREDNSSEHPQVEAAKQTNPLLRRFIDGQ